MGEPHTDCVQLEGPNIFEAHGDQEVSTYICGHRCASAVGIPPASRRRGSPKSDSFDILQDHIQALTVWTPERPFVTRKPLEHVLGRIDTFVLADAYPESVEVGGSEGRYYALHAVMTISGPSELPRHNVELVAKRIVDDNQTLGGVVSLAKDLLDGWT